MYVVLMQRPFIRQISHQFEKLKPQYRLLRNLHGHNNNCRKVRTETTTLIGDFCHWQRYQAAPFDLTPFAYSWRSAAVVARLLWLYVAEVRISYCLYQWKEYYMFTSNSNSRKTSERPGRRRWSQR